MALIEFQDGVTKGNAETFNHNFNEVGATNDSSLLINESDIIAITPSVGANYGNYGSSWYYKKGTKVHVHLGLSGLTANNTNDIFVLPEGYRPKGLIGITGLGEGMYQVIGGQVTTIGEIKIYPLNEYALFDVEFDAFS